MGRVVMHELEHIEPGCTSTIVGGCVVLDFIVFHEI